MTLFMITHSMRRVNDYPYGLSDVDVMSEDELYYDDLSDGSDNSDFDPYYY